MAIEIILDTGCWMLLGANPHDFRHLELVHSAIDHALRSQQPVAEDDRTDKLSTFPHSDLHQFSDGNFPGVMPVTAGEIRCLMRAEVQP